MKVYTFFMLVYTISYIFSSKKIHRRWMVLRRFVEYNSSCKRFLAAYVLLVTETHIRVLLSERGVLCKEDFLAFAGLGL